MDRKRIIGLDETELWEKPVQSSGVPTNLTGRDEALRNCRPAKRSVGRCLLQIQILPEGSSDKLGRVKLVPAAILQALSNNPHLDLVIVPGQGHKRIGARLDERSLCRAIEELLIGIESCTGRKT